MGPSQTHLPADSIARPRRRALLLATTAYSDPGLAALRALAGDVDALADVLADGSIGEFEVTRLVDRATEDVKQEIEGFFGDARRDDLLLLYFSCHGVLSQSRLYFATATTALKRLRATAIEDTFVNDVMQDSRARSIVLVLDCCYSGAFGEGLQPKSALTADVEHRFEGRGRVTLSASTALEYAFEEADPATGIDELEPAAPGSLFTGCLVQGLASGDADIDGDGHISLDDLYDYVSQRMREDGVHQTPGMAGDVRGEIVIARSRRRAALAAELQQAVDSPLDGVREGAVTELAELLRSADPRVAQAARAALERLARDDSQRVSARASVAVRPPPRMEPPPLVGSSPGEPPPYRRRWLRVRIPRLTRSGGGKPHRVGSEGLPPLTDRELTRVRKERAIEPVTGTTDRADTADVVDCTVFAPERVRPSQTVFVQVFAHLLKQAWDVSLLAKSFDRAARPRAVRSLASPIPRGCQLIFELRMPAATVEDPVQTLVWRGRPESVQFAVRLQGIPAREYIGTIVVRRDIWPVGHVKFKLDIDPVAAAASHLVPVGDQARCYTRAFLSYASEDRPKVIDRVQMLRLIQIEYFQDLLGLDPGERWQRRLYDEIERSDLFILFWSGRARASKWVRRETQHALAHRAGKEFGTPEICPVIVEGPPVAPPWKELADLHFNDALVYFKAGHP